jgi:hypothetical protein
LCFVRRTLEIIFVLFPLYLNISKLFGEVEPSFAQEFAGQLGAIWTVISGTRYFYLSYNQNVEDPMITEGWVWMRTRFRMEGHHNVIFKYHGGSHFRIQVMSQRTYLPLFPRWHSMSIDLRRSVTFPYTVPTEPPSLQEIVKMFSFIIFNFSINNFCIVLNFDFLCLI